MDNLQEIPREQILPRIRLENAWWSEPHEVPEQYTRWSPRPYIELFYPLLSNLDVLRAPVLMGPRRVGKTYLLHHCIQRLLGEEVVAPRRICYLSIDTPTYLGQSLESLLDLYQEAAGISLSRTSEPAFVLFDEIQYLPKWERHLKSLVDLYPHVRFAVSGSAAAALRIKSRESGAGRFTDFLLPPLTFHEYLSLVGRSDLVVTEVEADGLLRSCDARDLQELNEAFVDYISFGGYPEAALSKEVQKAPERFIKSDIIEKVLLRDIPQIYGISNVRELNALFTALAFNTARECTLEQLSQGAGVASPTIKKYIEYLEAAFLIRVLYRIDQDGRRFKRQRTFKIYLTNPSLRTALFGPRKPDDADFGHLVETAVFAQWLHSDQPIYYARWRSGELDFVSLQGRWALEVKWSDRPWADRRGIRRALEFCRKNQIPHLSVTTRSKEGYEPGEVKVSFVPAALYSYVVGHVNINSRRWLQDRLATEGEGSPEW